MGGGLLAARVVQILLGTAAVGLIYLTTRRWFDEKTALVAVALAALTGLFTFYEVLILQAALDPFLVAASLCLLTIAVQTDRPRIFVAAGIGLGLLALNRPNALAYAIVAVGLVAIRSRVRLKPDSTTVVRASALTMGLLVVLLPNGLRNYAASGELIWISSHGGLNFYIGNHEGADGTYSLVPGINPSIAGQARDAKQLAEASTGRALTTDGVSRYFYGRAWNWIADNPADAVRLFGRKILILLNHTNVPLNYSYAYYVQEERSLLRFLIVGPWLLLPLGLVGLFLHAQPKFLVWASFVPVYGLSVAAFFVSSRYRMPLLVPLCTTSAVSLVHLVDGRRAKRRGALAAPVLAIVVTGVLCAWDLGLDDGVGGEQTRKAAWLIESGRFDEARRYVDAIAPRHPAPGVLRFRVARALAKAGRTDDAIARFREALAIDRQPAIQLELGQALVASGRSAEAVPELTAAFDAGFQPEQAGPWLVRALALSGRHAEAVKLLATLPDAVAAGQQDTALELGSIALELQAPQPAERWLGIAVARTPGRAEAHEKLGLALLFQGRANEAISPLETAVRLDPSSATAHLNLAVIYAQVGRFTAARGEAETSLRLDPDEPRARELVKALPRRP